MLSRVNILTKVVLIIINIYKKIFSPFLGNRCRYYPCCSDYSTQAILKYGLFKGIIKSVRRIISCNPFNPGGVDEI